MKKDKLHNIIMKDLLKQYGSEQISIHKFSFKLLEKLYRKRIIEQVTYEYCCKGEDFNCWTEVDSCWVKNKKELYSLLKRRIKPFAYTRKMYVCECENTITLCIPCRDVVKQDYYVVFKKGRQAIDK